MLSQRLTRSKMKVLPWRPPSSGKANQGLPFLRRKLYFFANRTSRQKSPMRQVPKRPIPLDRAQDADRLSRDRQ